MTNADLVAAGVAVIGLAFTRSGARSVIRGRKALAWRSVTGEVLSSETKVVRDSSGESYARAAVRYRYHVGHERIGTRISFEAEFNSSDSSRALNWVLRYPKGTHVKVYYDPDDADEAVLEPGEGNLSVLFLGIGVVLIIGVLSYLARHSPFGR